MNSEPDFTLPWAKPKHCEHDCWLWLNSYNLKRCYDCGLEQAIDPEKPMLTVPNPW